MADQTKTALPLPIRQVAHWEIVIRPARFNPTLVSPVRRCEELVRECTVALRGWNYPHMYEEHSERFEDSVGSWGTFQHHSEYWRLFQSGQFFHLLAFRENAYRERFEAQTGSVLRLGPAGFVPSAYVDFASTVYTLTEMCVFASRLASRIPYPDEDPIDIAVSMIGVKNAVLTAWDMFKYDLWEFLRADQPRIDWTEKVGFEELQASPQNVALRAAQFFFEQFHWDQQPTQLFRQEQERLLSRRL
jgi:hypothetical protein